MFAGAHGRQLHLHIRLGEDKAASCSRVVRDWPPSSHQRQALPRRFHASSCASHGEYRQQDMEIPRSTGRTSHHPATGSHSPVAQPRDPRADCQHRPQAPGALLRKQGRDGSGTCLKRSRPRGQPSKIRVPKKSRYILTITDKFGDFAFSFDRSFLRFVGFTKVKALPLMGESIVGSRS